MIPEAGKQIKSPLKRLFNIPEQSFIIIDALRPVNDTKFKRKTCGFVIAKNEAIQKPPFFNFHLSIVRYKIHMIKLQLSRILIVL
jgi:hypothetical protein